jgi:polyphosphate kinase
MNKYIYIFIDDVLRELKNKIYPGIKLSNNTTFNMLLYADDMLIIQENEDTLQKSLYELQKKKNNNYNFNISITKTKVMAFQEKYPIRTKIILNNKSVIQQVYNFNYIVCNVTYKYDDDDTHP